ncbi:transglycosylase SLT domain-containing protein [Acinetobacter sp. B10A]|uniref:tape measure protein n=1 Tax=Acinetobacter baretiae TaxID=2605383 RepID=UPI001B3C5787|nr:tape measure protein [Acinetobacter baretiae]MBF7685966.1 transglycosylase SLT domain-containing protein [Acinetobacter baretiae]
MATKLGTLTLDLATRIAEFTGPLDRAEKKAKSSTDNIAQSFDNAASSVKVLAASVATAATSFVSFDKIIEVQRQFDKLNASLITATGSTENASDAFSKLQKFAQQTPYGLEQTVGGFTKLVNLGLTPSMKAMTAYGNTAAAMGKDLDQMIEAVADATTGEFERLKEFGIKSSQQGGKVALTFKGITTTINNSSKDIEKYLINLGETDFAGAMENRMKTLDGSIANLSDTVDAFFLKVSQSGVGDGLKTGVDATSDAVSYLGENLETVKDVAVAVGAAVATKLAISMAFAAKTTTLATIESVRYQMALVSMSAAASNTTRTMVTLRAITAALGGPAGIAILGVQALAAGAAFLYMRDSTNETTDALNDQGLTIDELKGKYAKLNAEQLRVKASDASKEISNQNNEIASSFDKLDKQVYRILTGAGTQGQATALQGYIDDLKAGGDRAANAFSILESKKVFSQAQIDAVAKVGINIKDARTEISKQNDILKIVNKTGDDSIKIMQRQNALLTDQARVLGLSAKQWEALSNNQKEYGTNIGNELLRKNYIAENTKNGKMTYEQASFMADARASAGLGYTAKDVMTPEVRKIIDAAWGVSGNFALNSNQQKKLAGASTFAALNNIESIGKNNALPNNLLTAILAQESGGNNSAISPTGAISAFQTTGIFRKSYVLSKSDAVNDPQKVAAAASKALQDAYETFGNWRDAAMAYNGGVAGTQAFKAGRISDQVTAQGGSQKINGQLYLSPAKAKEMSDYADNVVRYQAAASGNTKVDSSLVQPSQENYLKFQEQLAVSQKALKDAGDEFALKYAQGDLKKLDLEHSKAVEEITEKLGSDPEQLKLVLAQESQQYKLQRAELIANKKAEYQQYFSFETDRITQIKNNYAKEKSAIDANTKFDIAEKAKIKAAYDRQMQDEIDAVERANQERIDAAYEAYASETEVMIKRYQREREEIAKTRDMDPKVKDALLKANAMDQYAVLNKSSNKVQDSQRSANEYLFQQNNPNGKALWDLQNQYSSDQQSLTDSYNNNVSGIDQIQDETERNAQLLQAHEQYLQAKQALEDKYRLQQQDLANAQASEQLSAYGTMFGGMATLVKGFAGESNGAYKTMLAAQKAANLASAIMNGYTAISAAWASAPFPANLPAVALATVKTGVLQAGIDAVSVGFSSGGYTGDGGVLEPAGVVHKGEIVFSQADVARLGGVSTVEGIRKGIKGYSDGGVVGGSASIASQLSSNGQPQGNVNIEVNVTDSGVTTSGASTDNQKQLGQMIGNTVRTIIRQEQRQGGLLSK